MHKYMSNAEAIDLFKAAEAVRNDKSLNNDEINARVKKIHDTLVGRLSFLVYSNTKRYTKFSNHEDLVQEGLIGLLKAVRRFDYNRFPNFFIYADQWIKDRIFRAASRFDVVYSPNKSRVVYTEPQEGGANDIDENTPELMYFEKEKNEQINKILLNFPERDREIVKSIFGLDSVSPQTLRDVGPKYSVTHERARQIKNNIIDKLRQNKVLNEINQ